MKKKKDIKKLLLVLILLIGIGLTIAYFFNTSTFSNIFLATETPRMRTVEDFKSPDDWEPGDETKKTSETTNVDYDGNLCIRVKFDESWVSKNGDTLDGYQNGNRAAIINYDNKTKWLKGSDGWYYYTDELAKGETSVSPIKSVTYNPLIENDQKCEETVTGTKKRIKCYTSGDGYDGATYTLTITTEGMDCDTSKLIWDIPTTYSIKYNYNSTTYNTKVIPTGEMSDDTSIVSTETHQLKKNEYSRVGYRFLGWSDEENATEAKYTDEDEVAELGSDGKEVELYAVWQPQNLLVTINSLQEMTSDICENTYLPTNTISTTTTSQYFSLNRVPQATLVDTRDNISYKVRKFADGNCWIVDNLRLGSTGAITLTPDDSDVDSNFNLPQAPTTASSWTSVSMYQYTPLLYNTGNTSYGVFYNWHAATAGSEIYPLDTGAARPFIASNSICPKGWRLPTLGIAPGDNTADYARFIKAYNYTSGNIGTARKNVFNITTAGQYEPIDGKVQGSGSNSNWWTSVYTGEDLANYGIVNLFIRTDTSSSSQAITYGSSRMYYGNSVRCVAR